MVRLTRAVVLRGISKVSIDKRDTLEIDKEFGRITHLHLQKKNITTLDSLHLFQSLTVLYLYENQISKIEGLEQAYNLEILHLQRNQIQRMENLLHCKKLRKLYIGYNEIETVEGLHKLVNLEELHVEHQRLQQGMSLSFDPKSLSTLCNSLIVLNISGNNITHFEDLAGMDELHTLQATENAVTDLDSTSLVIRTLGNLRVLDLRGNPIARKPQFKERIIGFAGNIAILNEKEVSDTTREFIQRFAAVKANRLQHAVNAFKRSTTEVPTSTSCGSEQQIYPINTPYAFASSEASTFGDTTPMPNSHHGMTPTRSNLSLSLPPGRSHFHSFRQGFELEIPSEKSLTQINAYLSNTDVNNLYRNSTTPQFILAPPSQDSLQPSLQHLQLNGSFHSMPDVKSRRGSLKSITSPSKRNSVSVPSFKKKMSSISEDREDIEDSSNFNIADKDPSKSIHKSREDVWSSTGSGGRGKNKMRRAVVNLIKPPVQVRCSRQSFMEGMPMPSPGMLRMANNHSGDLNIEPEFRLGYNPPISPKLQLRNKTTRNDTTVRPSKNMKAIPDQLKEVPPFTTSVYELPPWPHIIKRWTTEQPAVTFMP